MRRTLLLIWLFLLPLALGGCMMSASPEDLYALPQLPAEYESLSAHLTAVLSNGAEYAPPQAGGNLPPVQMVDLDGFLPGQQRGAALEDLHFPCLR